MSGEYGRDTSAMSVKELKTLIASAGLSTADCFEVQELRDRAQQADEKLQRLDRARQAKNAEEQVEEPSDDDTSPQEVTREVPEETQGLRERSTQGSATPSMPWKPSDEENTLKRQVAALEKESGQVISGRDASAILAEVDGLTKKIADATLTADGRTSMLASLESVRGSLGFENALEQKCGRIVQLGLLAVTFVPMLLSCLESGYEFANRPDLVVTPANLTNMHAVVTGGCGAVGLDLAMMLANSGAEVVMSCHGSETCEADEIESRLATLGLLRGETISDDGSARKGWVDVWPLQLESFTSVREFTALVAKQWDSVDIVVHNAATKNGCVRTVDGHEQATQVNYLSPFLLTQQLMPILRRGTARVVHVTCDAGLQVADWLPWPLRRTTAELLPRINWEGLKQRDEGKNADTVAGDCNPLVEYANSKLATVVHSRELNREMSRLNRGVSHVVNPGVMDSPFGRGDIAPVGKPSMRSSMMGNLPPVWIANKVYQFTVGKLFAGMGTHMLRKPSQGAKAIFHVATSSALGYEEHGGGLFSDTYGAFTDCGKFPEDCGRVPLKKQPSVTRDEELATELWTYTESVLAGDAED